ncbi:4-hydroxyphenylpyruvate dioxygenase [Cysteiniphilum sp. QT6929]|uniref:4-hydroxyphenylpyruvate dioxygenase n=1 Tax=Cysteiniphilum sp. QT6929 TaxID=2975055 RepID=UPI0024B39F76|nr:4-hydroxyphenylpyruvate dioxygenase [Cysteiniphilum sp. QT6929]WHN65706.1 4-hydroxyphenylpyruvate dioxygenase [Cysteiniphilum sp. QT6929]
MSKMDITTNPAGTRGFSFLEFVSTTPQKMRDLFSLLGFTLVGQHKTKTIELWQQNDIFFLLNNESQGFAKAFKETHQSGACGMGFVVENVEHALAHCIKKGAKLKTQNTDDWHGQSIEVIHGIADTKLYLTDYSSIIDSGLFEMIPDAKAQMQDNECGLLYIDHLTHNVFRGNMDKWADYYIDLFNFRQIRYFDIEGKLTGLLSRAMTSPCLKIKIPINESADDHSQIEEFLREFNGEGIQHIALESQDIFATVEKLKDSGVEFMHTPDSYYTKTHERLPYHPESVERMHKNRILIDGAPTKDGGYLLQIFTNTVIGPVFFEIIQRKGDDGFGEGNFQALFDSIELDQIERGVLSTQEHK